MTADRPLLDRFYPILPDAIWMRRIVPLGVRTVQLRVKDQSASEVRVHIRDSLAICRDHHCQLIVNDHWRAALDLGCDFIHLGQEDLAAADLDGIKRARVRFGLSTHDVTERAVALAAKPDYIALGPVYQTKLKAMRWAPQGLDRVAEWKAAVGAVPLVAIGGITPERAGGVLAAGADCVAVITDFITHTNPVARVRDWLAWAKQFGAKQFGAQPSGPRGTPIHTRR